MAEPDIPQTLQAQEGIESPDAKIAWLSGKKYIAGAFLFVLMFGIGYLGAPIRITPQEFLIPKGASAREVAQTLKNENIIRSQNLFLLYLRLQGGELSLRPGTYRLDGAYSIPSLVRLFTSQPLDERTVVIPEGLILVAISRILESSGVTSGDEFLKTAMHPSGAVTLKFSFLRPLSQGASLEGYLFPDTYKFFAKSSPEDIIERMLETFEKRLTQNGIFDQISASKQTLHEVVILASILEEEAATTEDRELIAGILSKRIDQGLPLQVDSTLMYVTGRGTKLLTVEDLALASPYNTYRYKGLPAGPISSPGIDAIDAALHPKPSPYLYYLSDSAGKIYYSRTFEEHKEKKLKYLK